VVGLRARLIAMLVIVMLLAFGLVLLGVNFGLRSDVNRLASQSVDAGSNALASAVAARVDQVRSLILQGSAQPSLARALQTHDTAALRSAASDTAISGNLSFVVITDAKGNVLAGSRAASGTLANDGLVKSALQGSMIGGPESLSGAQLQSLGVTVPPPAIVIATASPVNVNGAVVGVLYGGQVLDATTKFVDDVSQLTGGQTGVVVDGKLTATSLATKDGAKQIGLAIAGTDSVVHDRTTFTGEQVVDATNYFVKLSPLASYDGSVIGAYWFGVPAAQFDAVITHTLGQIALWGLIGLVFALVAGTYLASRIGRAIIQRSEEVNESAQELRVLVVGGEVSGDHVERTRATLEEIKTLVTDSRPDHSSEYLRTLTHQAVDDVVVIDTLTAELSTRMRDAAERVERLSAVAKALDELVAGARPSRN
jgi:hypothetical protein